jgi:CheY-like chemotaxis protein
VRAESAGEGRGATFTVTLPPALAEPIAVPDPGAAPEHTASLRGIRVLVVDDDDDARAAIAAGLTSEGAEVCAVPSAAAARAEVPTFGPDVLVSDIAMPGEDGYALLRALRAREAKGQRLAACALTAAASAADRQRALEVGFDAYLAKPATPSEVASVVARLGGR